MRKYYPGITLFKLIGSILVVLSHVHMFQYFHEHNRENTGTNPFYNILVPCFYIISGFLVYKGWSHAANPYQYVKRYLTWIILIYSLFCLILLVRTVIGQGFNPNTFFALCIAFFVAGPYYQLWFIPPLIFSMIFCYFFERRNKLRLAIILAACGFVFAQFMTGTLKVLTQVTIGDIYLFHMKYSKLLDGVSLTYLGFGLPFVLTGVVIGKYEEKFLRSRISWLLLISVLVFTAEFLFLNYLAPGDHAYFLVFNMLPAAILLFYGVLRVKMDGIKAHHAFINLFSIVIFFSQILFIHGNMIALKWQFSTMSWFQRVVIVLLTLIEGLLVTLFIMFLQKNVKGLSKQRTFDQSITK